MQRPASSCGRVGGCGVVRPNTPALCPPALLPSCQRVGCGGMIVCGLSMGARLTSSSPLQRFERDLRYRLATSSDVADELKLLARVQSSERGHWSTSLDGAARPASSSALAGMHHGTPAGRSASPLSCDSSFDGSSPRSGSPDSLEPEQQAELQHFSRFCRLKPGHRTLPLWDAAEPAHHSRQRRRRSPPSQGARSRRLPSVGSRPTTRERPLTRESALTVRTSVSRGGSEATRGASARAESPDTTFWPEIGERAAVPNALAVTNSVRVAHLEATRARTASELGKRPSSGARAALHWASNAPSPLDRRGTKSWWVHLGKDKTGKAGADLLPGAASAGVSTDRYSDSFSSVGVPSAVVGVKMGSAGFPASTGASGPLRAARRKPRSTEGVLSGGGGDAGDMQVLSQWGADAEDSQLAAKGLRAWTPE